LSSASASDEFSNSPGNSPRWPTARRLSLTALVRGVFNPEHLEHCRCRRRAVADERGGGSVAAQLIFIAANDVADLWFAAIEWNCDDLAGPRRSPGLHFVD
jgi:hypothetical protein